MATKKTGSTTQRNVKRPRRRRREDLLGREVAGRSRMGMSMNIGRARRGVVGIVGGERVGKGRRVEGIGMRLGTLIDED